jgi:predicted DNA-binding transcriptional regulator AlpA
METYVMTAKVISVGELPVTGYMRQAQLIPAIIPFSTATLWRKVRSGDFPPPIKLSERITAWRVEDIRAWMESRHATVKQPTTLNAGGERDLTKKP